MPFPDYESTSSNILLDLEDERRSKKPWLPQDDRDVTNLWVYLDAYPGCEGLYPACVIHGAMLCVSEERHIWRCGEHQCGLGAIYKRVLTT